MRRARNKERETDGGAGAVKKNEKTQKRRRRRKEEVADEEESFLVLPLLLLLGRNGFSRPAHHAAVRDRLELDGRALLEPAGVCVRERKREV